MKVLDHTFVRLASILSCAPLLAAGCSGVEDVATTSAGAGGSLDSSSSVGGGGEGGGAGGAGGGAGGAGGSAPATEPRYHLVVDSGSSGTRFCVFDVTRELASERCSVGAAPAICGKGSGGLAALTDGKPVAEVNALVLPKFEAAWTALEEAWVTSGRDKALLEKLDGAAALGTGGYRDPATAAPAMNPAWDEVWKSFEAYFQAKGIGAVVAKAIPGEDEARLAWVGVREAVAPSEAFAIIETGGATLQLAAGAPGDAYEALVGTSIYRGLNYEFAALGTDPGFSVCSSPADRSQQSGASCIDFLLSKVHSDNALVDLAKTISARPLYGLGAPWTGLFKEYPNQPPWMTKTGPELHSDFTLTNLRGLATLVCPMSDDELAGVAPESYEAVGKTGRACYATSYHAAYLESVKALAKDETIRPGGDDQWARGASVTPKFFSACK
jgi:hypothetical protein